MSAGMADVIAAHVPTTSSSSFNLPESGSGRSCRYGLRIEVLHSEMADTDSSVQPYLDRKLAAHLAEELEKAGYGNVQKKGYLIVDKVTGALDWDGELHATVEAAISSMCGPHQSFCRDPEDFTGDDTTYWADVYAIHPVSAPLDPNLAAALADPEGHALVKAIHDRKTTT